MPMFSLNKECRLKVRWILESKGSVVHILDLARKMSQPISEGKKNSVRKGAFAMIGSYAKSYISLLSDDARKYRPNTHGTSICIVPQRGVQNSRAEFGQVANGIPSSVPTYEDKQNVFPFGSK